MTTLAPASGRRITGKHVFLMFAGFFGFIIIVNIYLLYAALSTFRGLDVDSSYRAGKAFPQEIEAARAQEARGWKVDLVTTLSPEGALALRFEPKDASGAVQAGLKVSLVLQHPVDRRLDRSVVLEELSPGVYVAASSGVKPGQWTLALEAHRGTDRMYRTIERVVLR